MPACATLTYDRLINSGVRLDLLSKSEFQQVTSAKVLRNVEPHFLDGDDHDGRIHCIGL